MALTPINYAVVADQASTNDVEQEVEPSLTWQLSLETGRINGLIDGKDAVRQYIRKALMTPRNQYLIYDDEYGEEISTLIGSNLTQAVRDVELPRLVRETIEYDDRISAVRDIVITPYNADSVHITFTVELIDGELLEEGVIV